MTDVLDIVRSKAYVTVRCVTESNIKYLLFKLSLTNKTSLKQCPCMGIHILVTLSSYTFIAVGKFKYPHTQGTYTKPILVIKITMFLLSYIIQEEHWVFPLLLGFVYIIMFLPKGKSVFDTSYCFYAQ
jgi:hypothetical protein